MQTPRDLAEAFVVLAMLVLIAVLCECCIPNWSSASSRLLAPWEFVPSVGSVEIVSVTPGNTDVLVGASVEIAAEIKNPAGEPHRALLFVTAENEAESQSPMTADEKHQRFKLTVPSVLEAAASTAWRSAIRRRAIYTIGVREKPVVEGVEVTFRYPAYLGRKDETFSQKGLDLEAPQYTVAELRLRLSEPIAKGYLESGGERLSRPRRRGRQAAGGRHALVERTARTACGCSTTPATPTPIRG